MHKPRHSSSQNSNKWPHWSGISIPNGICEKTRTSGHDKSTKLNPNPATWTMEQTHGRHSGKDYECMQDVGWAGKIMLVDHIFIGGTTNIATVFTKVPLEKMPYG